MGCRSIQADVDLTMTGNGTQAIVWQINEETYRKTLETEYSELGPENQDSQSITAQFMIYYRTLVK